MGLLSEGTPLHWQDVAQYADHVREHGIIQLLNTIAKYKQRHGDPLLWGDELEYMVVDFHDGKAVLSIRQEEILGKLMVDLHENVKFHQEYGRYMVESTPAVPFNESLKSINDLEQNMNLRRLIAQNHVSKTEKVLTVASFPTLGTKNFANCSEPVNGKYAKSLFLPDDIINLHPRFPTLSQNIRERRGKKVEILIPAFQDKIPFEDKFALNNQLKNMIYMDAMGFGMGCCCVQVTFQGESFLQTREMYDFMIPLTPLMLTISAASPIFRGVLSNQDVRWNVVSMSVDDRTDLEKNKIKKSRYDSVDLYIAANDKVEDFNDTEVLINEKVALQLRQGGLDNQLVKHFAHLFIRDPLVIFKENIHQNDLEDTDHFENIQSTNWQTVRFKPPPNDEIGWRAEFRPMEIQITDFENAALCAFLVLLVHAFNHFKLNLYMPISQVETNMASAHVINPVVNSKFYFRTNIFSKIEDKAEIELLTLNEIFNGNKNFTGLVNVVKRFLKEKKLEGEFSKYIDFVSKRASGEIITNAQFIRNFVLNHPKYGGDSLVTDEINYDLMMEVSRLSKPSTRTQ